MTLLPVITIQSDWNETLRLPHREVWISAKYLNESSLVNKILSSLNKESKIELDVSNNYEYISHGNFSLVLKHINSGLKVAFVAPTKVHDKVHKKAVVSVALGADSTVVSASEDNELSVWDGRSGEQLLKLEGHGVPVYKCRFFPSGLVVLTAGSEGTCKIWSSVNGQNPVTLKGHKMAVTDVAIVEKGRNVISVSKDGSVKLWDVGTSNCLDTIIDGLGPINCCAIGYTSDDENFVKNEREVGTVNKVITIGCESGLVVACHVSKRQEAYRIQLESPCNACAMLEYTAVIGCQDGMLVHLDRDGSVLREWKESASPVFTITALTEDLFCVGRQDGTCTVLSVNEAHHATRVQLTGSDFDGIRDIAFNGKWIYTACRDCAIRKYDYKQISIHYK